MRKHSIDDSDAMRGSQRGSCRWYGFASSTLLFCFVILQQPSGVVASSGQRQSLWYPIALGVQSALEGRQWSRQRDPIQRLLQGRPALAASVEGNIHNSKIVQAREAEDESKSSEYFSGAMSTNRGGAAVAVRPLLFWETMVCGAISRSTAQTILHPANTMKTMLQNSRAVNGATAVLTLRELAHPRNFRRLSVGAGANFILSVPHGAVNFAVLELVRRNMQALVDRIPQLDAERLGPGLDFCSSCISTITCSVVSTPQMMITDNIMAGNYPNLFGAIRGLASEQGIMGFYRGWWPGLVGKIPSYALTWTLFQQLKRVHQQITMRPAKDWENSGLGCLASTTTVCIMIPMDTIKTRLVTQVVGSEMAYKGVIDCAIRIFREEGMATFYRGLPPRLVSVVPMIGIQFGVYEAMKKFMIQRSQKAKKELDNFGSRRVFAEAAMEVAASPEHPYPAPHFLKRRDKRPRKASRK